MFYTLHSHSTRYFLHFGYLKCQTFYSSFLVIFLDIVKVREISKFLRWWVYNIYSSCFDTIQWQTSYFALFVTFPDVIKCLNALNHNHTLYDWLILHPNISSNIKFYLSCTFLLQEMTILCICSKFH